MFLHLVLGTMYGESDLFIFLPHLVRKMAFIVFEGLDGVGKSTIIEKCSTRFNNSIVTSDPKGSFKSRQLYISNIGTCADELDLFIKCRQIVVDDIIIPSLDKGLLVLCDRYIESSHAYQGALNVPQYRISKLNSNFPIPDVTFLITCDEDTRLKRLGDKLDVIESRGKEYFSKVDEIYKTRARDNGYVVIDNSNVSISDTIERIVSIINML